MSKATEDVGAIALCKSSPDRILVAQRNGFHFARRPEAAQPYEIGERVETFQADKPTRTNDSRVDAQGRFVVSGYSDAEGETRSDRAVSSVVRVSSAGQGGGGDGGSAKLKVEQLLETGIECGNSICFGLGGEMYWTDSKLRPRRILVEKEYAKVDKLSSPEDAEEFVRWPDEWKTGADPKDRHPPVIDGEFGLDLAWIGLACNLVANKCPAFCLCISLSNTRDANRFHC